jgi:hypothetical protein
VYVNKVKSPDLVLGIGNIDKKTMTCILCNSMTMTYDTYMSRSYAVGLLEHIHIHTHIHIQTHTHIHTLT